MTVRILEGDVLARLAELPDASVHCCVTSPPYYGLRDYGVAGQIGLEPTLAEYVEKMVAVFREVRRVLRDDGTLWLNIGDSYANDAKWGGSTGGKHVSALHDTNVGRGKRKTGMKPKDLMGVPWRVAFALQADGWYLRQDIIWHKPNPMPESIRDRCTKAHEYVFLLSKSQRYYYDFDAMQEPASENTNPRKAGNGYKTPDGWDTGKGSHGSFHKDGREKGRTGYEPKPRVPGNVRPAKGQAAYEGGDNRHRTKAGLLAYAEKARKLAESGSGTKNNGSFDEAMSVMPATRNMRSVWSITTEAFPEAHFATFPTEIPRRAIVAGCPPGGTVLDPFGGSGTTGLVADRLQRDAILIELNPAYAAMARKRIAGDSPLFVEVA